MYAHETLGRGLLSVTYSHVKILNIIYAFCYLRLTGKQICLANCIGHCLRASCIKEIFLCNTQLLKKIVN